MLKEKLDKNTLIRVIFAKKGFISQVAATLGVDVKTIYNYRDRYPAVAEALAQARNSFDETILDTAEFKLFDAINSGQAWAIRYALDKKGKVRGYNETQSSQVEVVEVVYTNNDTD